MHSCVCVDVRMNQDLRAALGGAAAGAIATVPMSAAMLIAREAGQMGRYPPEIIADKALHTAGAQPSGTEKDATALFAHFAFGAAAGALFGLMYHRANASGTPLVAGIGYGLAVYATSYAGWIPAADIMPSPTHDRPGRQPSMATAHVVFGAALAALVPMLVPQVPQRQ